MTNNGVSIELEFDLEQFDVLVCEKLFEFKNCPKFRSETEFRKVHMNKTLSKVEQG